MPERNGRDVPVGCRRQSSRPRALWSGVREFLVNRILWAAPLSFVLAMTSTETSQTTSGGLPPRLDSYLTSTVKLTADERKRLTGGAPITKLLDVDGSKEVAVFGAVWINAPIRRYVEAVKDIENFEQGGGFKLTKRIAKDRPHSERLTAGAHSTVEGG